MTELTKEGNQVYSLSSPIREAVHKECVCKTCWHLGDLCGDTAKIFARFDANGVRVHNTHGTFPAGRRVQISCNGHTTIPKTNKAENETMPPFNEQQLKDPYCDAPPPEQPLTKETDNKVTDNKVGDEKPVEIFSNDYSIDAYNEMVSRLAKPGEVILASMTPAGCHKLHMLIGLNGEYFELTAAYNAMDKVNFREESGDFHFYMEGIAQAYNVQLFMLPRPKTDHGGYVLRAFNQALGDLTDLVKKEAIYCKEDLLPKILTALGELYFAFAALLAKGGFSIDDIRRANMDKLLYGENGKRARYAQGRYTDQQAIDRADKPAGE